MKTIITLLISILSQVQDLHGDPFALPLHGLLPYYESRDTSAKVNPIPYDHYGPPPDFFPAIVPDIGSLSSPEYYGSENDTYPGINEFKKCDSVKNCPVKISDDHISDPNAPFFPVNFPGNDRSWECRVEVDCFAQAQIPDDLSNETEILFLRVFSFTKLEVGNLSVLPPLVKLRIEYSDLATIEPGAFSSQSTLEILELEGNDLENIQPSTFAELKDLISLDLSNNQIKTISRDTFRGLDALDQIRLATNFLSEIPAFAFAEMPNLVEITLDDNNITVLANESFSALPKLKTISLTHNMLGSVPNIALREPPALINLHLSGNPIGRIFRNDFKGLERLEVLWLDQCNLESIEKRAFHNKMFRTLVLSDNYLTSVPYLGTMRKMRELIIDHNRWKCDCNMTATKKWLKRHSKSLQSQDPICTTPDYFYGRRVLEISNDDLCSKPPPHVHRLPIEQKPDIIKPAWPFIPRQEDHTPENDYEETEGWSDVTYEVGKLYTISDTKPTLQETAASQVTTKLPETEVPTDKITKEETHSPSTTGNARITVTESTDAFTARDLGRGHSSTDAKTMRESSTSDKSDEQPVATKTPPNIITEYPISKVTGEISVLAIVLPVVAAAVVFIAVLLVIVFKKLTRKRQMKLAQKDKQWVEYKASNGTHNGNAKEGKQDISVINDSTEVDSEVPVDT